MGKNSNIDWTDHTWNPWQGCQKVSPGCANCYMYRDKKRFGQDPTTVIRSKSATFDKPLNWKEPAKVFVCSWSDFFIEDAIMAYVARDAFPYHGYLDCYTNATPKPKTRVRVVGQLAMMVELEARGFTMTTVKSWESAKDPIILCSNIFCHCGEVPAINAKWPHWLLEEIEVSPNTKDSGDNLLEIFSNMIDGD